jgi:hypothetical protein
MSAGAVAADPLQAGWMALRFVVRAGRYHEAGALVALARALECRWALARAEAALA